MKRRQFIRIAGLSVTFAAPWACSSQAQTRVASDVHHKSTAIGLGGRPVVLIELNGGNDGLNTVVPYEDDAYHSVRPNLAIGKGYVLKLEDDLGLNPELEP